MLALELKEPGVRPGSDSVTSGVGVGVTSWLMFLYMQIGGFRSSLISTSDVCCKDFFKKFFFYF